MAPKKIRLTLLVDKENKRVVYAESGKDFVETLLSFLIIPIGTVIKLSGKKPKMGSLTMLYRSLEDLELEFLSTKSCKGMPLHPKSSAEGRYKNLPLMANIGTTKPTKYYICSRKCGIEEEGLVSTVKHARCRCGRTMNHKIHEKKRDVDADGGDGVFIKGKMRFMIRDDLQVSILSSTKSFTMLRELGISDASVLEERHVKVCEKKVLHLLKCLLLSKTSLTDVFMGELNTVDTVDLDINVIALDSDEMFQSQPAEEIGSDSRKMIVKLFMSKSNKKVFYIEGGEDFTDLLFSLLAFPLGSIVKCLGGCSGMGCLDNLYKSTEDLSFQGCMKSKESKDILLNPELAPYFGTKNQLLKIEEQVPLTDLGGAFLAGPARFMVTDELIVKPLSPILGISFLNRFSVPISDIEEQTLCIGKKEAMSLLKASLISNSVLSNVFYSKKPKQMETKPAIEDFFQHSILSDSEV